MANTPKLTTSDVWHAAMDVHPQPDASNPNGPSKDAAALARELEAELRKQGWKQRNRLWFHPTGWKIARGILVPVSSGAKARLARSKAAGGWAAMSGFPVLDEEEQAELARWARAVAGLPEPSGPGQN